MKTRRQRKKSLLKYFPKTFIGDFSWLIGVSRFFFLTAARGGEIERPQDEEQVKEEEEEKKTKTVGFSSQMMRCSSRELLLLLLVAAVTRVLWIKHDTPTRRQQCWQQPSSSFLSLLPSSSSFIRLFYHYTHTQRETQLQSRYFLFCFSADCVTTGILPTTCLHTRTSPRSLPDGYPTGYLFFLVLYSVFKELKIT